jgi:hypothetical protein
VKPTSGEENGPQGSEYIRDYAKARTLQRSGVSDLAAANTAIALQTIRRDLTELADAGLLASPSCPFDRGERGFHRPPLSRCPGAALQGTKVPSG